MTVANDRHYLTARFPTLLLRLPKDAESLSSGLDRPSLFIASLN